MMQERCAGADTISLVARLMQKSKAHIQSILLHNNSATVEDFYVHLVHFDYLFLKEKNVFDSDVSFFLVKLFSC